MPGRDRGAARRRRPVDVLHLHDWQAMPAVVLRDCRLRGYRPLISNAAVMVTIHNLAYQGWLTRDQVEGMLFPGRAGAGVAARAATGMLLLREGIGVPRLVNTVSPGYAQEVTKPEPWGWAWTGSS
jgi:starch synthase